MALEDICGFEDTFLHRKWFPASCFEDTATFFPMTNSFGSWKTRGTPLHFSVPPLPFSQRLSFPVISATHPPKVQRPFPLSHGTTTLGFTFQGGVIAAADTRASSGALVQCSFVNKITPIHSHLVVTSSGSGADCMLWERILIREIRLYELRHKRRLSIRGSAKLLSFMLHPFKGTEVCVALTLCGWDMDADNSECAKRREDSSSTTDASFSDDVCRPDIAQTAYSVTPNSGPRLVYVCSDGTHLQGDIFSVGSGSPYAYGILDGDVRWSLSDEKAISLAREAVFRATHRDAYSGNNVDVFHITAQGWSQREREDLKEEYFRDKERKMKMVEERKRLSKLDASW